MSLAKRPCRSQPSFIIFITHPEPDIKTSEHPSASSITLVKLTENRVASIIARSF